ncbi:MAG: sigma-54 dependent transcriptional regulator [Proteobacteria bacterium]|nr:sigma-54 dependent transcriptional regulator [Pseudomonadota bacterium]MBU1742633.1 sigma-54 dependent transcriptional regulator [Pseudomonadota bacterium]
MEETVAKILIVDDEERFLESISERMRLLGFEPLTATHGLEAIETAKNRDIDLAIVDLNMPDLDGLVIIAKLKEIHPDLRTVLLTAHGDEKVKQATEALNAAYFEKDDMSSLWGFIKKFRSKSGMIIITPPADVDESGGATPEGMFGIRPEEIELLAARQTLEKRKRPLDLPAPAIEYFQGPRLIGETPPMQELKNSIAKVAVLDCTVLIQGETGTGKELVAKAIHNLSPRRGNRFLAINCGSFSQELLSNELFGHEKEAFTGAVRTKKGMFEASSGGTLLLDEVGDTPPPMQVQLLRVLQERTIIRVGGTEEIPVDGRVLAATNQSLKKKVEAGQFREDLYYRLNGFEIRIPPLRERRDDIPPLCSYFLDKYRREFDKEVEHVSDEVIEVFMSYPFPGNVRELANVIERAVILCEDRVIERQHLPGRFKEADHFPPQGRQDLVTLAEMEERYIFEVLAACRGNKTRASEILGINRASLWRKLKRLQAEAEA